MSAVNEPLLNEECSYSVFVRESPSVATYGKEWLWLAQLSEPDVFALLGCLGEDPQDWPDVTLVWPRYRMREGQSELIEGWVRRELTIEEAAQQAEQSSAWLAVDLDAKRLITGGDFPRLSLLGQTSEFPSGEPTLLPPWWELHQDANSDVFSQTWPPKTSPTSHREILWGEPLVDYLVESVLCAARNSDDWSMGPSIGPRHPRHELTDQIHRTWLMVPRQALGNRSPRECLHLGIDWIERLIEFQIARLEDEPELKPVPPQFGNLSTAPMGRHEVILYFDTCRTMLAAAWQWLSADESRLSDPQVEGQLRQVILESQKEFLERGRQPSPADTIRHERDRIPFVQDSSQEMFDCDCPLCQMAADGMMGPSILFLDGCHLEMEDDFAFSLYATETEWRRNAMVEDTAEFDWLAPSEDSELEEPAEWSAMRAALEGFPLLSSPAQDDAPPDEWSEPTWKSSYVDERAFSSLGQGTLFGHLGVAFRLAEIVDDLKSLAAKRREIDDLNDRFLQFRTAESACSMVESARDLNDCLHTIGRRFPSLTRRCADLQSQIDGNVRMAIAQD